MPAVSQSPDGVCLGLGPAIDALALALDSPDVPTPAMVAGAKVVSGFDAACQ